MYFFLVLHQPPDLAVVVGSETQLPPQQTKNILQVRRVYQYKFKKYTTTYTLGEAELGTFSTNKSYMLFNVCNICLQ